MPSLQENLRDTDIKNATAWAVAFEIITFATLPHDPALFDLFHGYGRTQFFVASDGVF
jgi:hypothetical protein